MENTNKGVIVFNNYRVKNVIFELNSEYNQEEVNIDFDIKANVKISENSDSMIVEMKLNIFKDAIEKHYPFTMELVIEGMFTINPEEKGNVIEKYQGNAMAILFPYARSLVSTYTANSNVSALILPTININKYLKKT